MSDVLTEKERAGRFATLLLRALPLASDLDEAMVATELAMAYPDDRSPAPPEPSVFLAHDIFNKRAQGILNKAIAASKKLSSIARDDLRAALEKPESKQPAAIVKFMTKYRLQMANLLGATALASLLEGALEVANKFPQIPPPGTDMPLPPTLPPEDATKLIDKLRKLPEQEQAQELYKLPFEQQRFVAVQLRQAPPDKTPPSWTPPAPDEDDPAYIHYPVIEEAARILAQKNVVTRERFDRLSDAARQKAFTVAQVASEETLAKIRDALSETVEEGVDLEVFRAKVLESVGEGTFLSDAHMETVFRGGIQSAFSDGQMSVLKNPFVRGGFPYAAYEAIHDDRVRHDHLALEKHGIGGTNIYRIDDPVFETFRPPWDFNDRCSFIPLTVRQAAERGVSEAEQWMSGGIEPSPPSFVKMPPFKPSSGFQREAVALSIRSSWLPIEIDFDEVDVMLGMVGDEWHGPKPPGEGWVELKPGPRGGKRWKKGAGAAPYRTRAQVAAARPKPEEVAASVKAMLAAGEKITTAHVQAFAETLMKMRVVDIHAVKRSLDLKASGNKLVLASKVAVRALTNAREAMKVKAPASGPQQPTATKPPPPPPAPSPAPAPQQQPPAATPPTPMKRGKGDSPVYTRNVNGQKEFIRPFGPDREPYLKREMATRGVANLLGMPTTQMKVEDVPGIGRATVSPDIGARPVGANPVPPDQLSKAVTFDIIIGNGDSNRGNYFLKDGQIIGHDYELAFGNYGATEVAGTHDLIQKSGVNHYAVPLDKQMLVKAVQNKDAILEAARSAGSNEASLAALNGRFADIERSAQEPAPTVADLISDPQSREHLKRQAGAK